MRKSDQDSLWVASFLGVFLAAVVGLHGYNHTTGLSTKLSRLEKNLVVCSEDIGVSRQELTQSLGDLLHKFSDSSQDLGERMGAAEYAVVALTQDANYARIELLLLQNAVAAAQKALAEEKGDRLRGQEIFSHQSDAINRLAELLKPEDLRAKAQHYLLTQAKVVTAHGTGSGTMLKGNLILTCFHVVDGEEGHVTVEIPNADGSHSTYPVQVIKGSKARDLALLKVLGAKPLPFVTIKSKEDCASFPVLSPVIIIGYPAGYGPYFTHGELVNKTNVQPEFPDCWRVNSNMFFGNSGGGCFDAATGELIGVPMALSVYQIPLSWMGIIIPAHRVLEWMESK